MDRNKEQVFKGKPEEIKATSTEKKKRVRRTQKQVVLDKIEKIYKQKVLASIYGAEIKKITESLDILQSSILKKKKPKDDVILDMFSAEELEALLKQKKQMETK